MFVTGAIDAVIGGIGGAIYLTVKYGEVRWQNVVAGAVIGGRFYCYIIKFLLKSKRARATE